jgi:tRNA pseudouridine55 synthase
MSDNPEKSCSPVEKPEPHGLIVIDKPPGPTSFDCIRFLRKTCNFPRKWKIGHLGTLDPFASGVMVIALGQAVRYSTYAVKSSKEYRARLWLGEETDTLDFTGQVTDTKPIPNSWVDRLPDVVGKFTGKYMQTPPAYSAKQVNGKRSYKAARNGETLDLKPVEVDIFFLEFHRTGENWVDFTTKVSGGTYIRSLGQDIAVELGTLGYLVGLERIASGPFIKKEAIPFTAFETGGPQVLMHHLRPVDQILSHLESITVKNESTGKLKHGKTLHNDDLCDNMPDLIEPGKIFRILDLDGNFRALGKIKKDGIIPFKAWLV